VGFAPALPTLPKTISIELYPGLYAIPVVIKNIMRQLILKKIGEFALGIGLGAIVFGSIWLAMEFRFAPEPPRLPLPINTMAATVLSEPMAIPSFTLTDHHGQPFTEQSLRGQWTFMFFGYTYCPDICPTTLTILGQVDKLLQDAKVRPRFIFVSVDPLRDTTAKLAEYVPYFNPEFRGVTGSKEQIQILTQPLGIYYKRSQDSETNENYLINHSSSILLIEPQVRLRALISPPHDAATIATDYQKIIDFLVK